MSKCRVSRADHQDALRVLLERYEYDPSGGIRHKGEKSKCRKVNVARNGYSLVTIRIGGVVKKVSCHLAVWVVCKHQWPKYTIDHIDGNRHNNHIENLRDCTASDNCLNKPCRWIPNAKTGLPSVWKRCDGNGYQIKIMGRMFRFRDKYEAFNTGIMLGRTYR